MTNQEILTKAIEKAIDGGWLDGDAALNQLKTIPEWALGGQTAFSMSVIFNHDFAKALWHDAIVTNMNVYVDSLYTSDENLSFVGLPWQYHLQQMVIADDPIKYLGDNM